MGHPVTIALTAGPRHPGDGRPAQVTWIVYVHCRSAEDGCEASCVGAVLEAYADETGKAC